MGWFGEAVGGGGRVAGRAAENRATARTATGVQKNAGASESTNSRNQS